MCRNKNYTKNFVLFSKNKKKGLCFFVRFVLFFKKRRGTYKMQDYNWHGVKQKAWKAPGEKGCFFFFVETLYIHSGLAVECAEQVRSDQGNKTLAHEFLDSEEVLAEKIQVLVKMIRKGQVTVYSGAGLSRASGIPDYASKAKNSLSNTAKKLLSPLDAVPTLSHAVIARLCEAGFVTEVVNQNHGKIGVYEIVLF
jgi:hypothetical protein